MSGPQRVSVVILFGWRQVVRLVLPIFVDMSWGMVGWMLPRIHGGLLYAERTVSGIQLMVARITGGRKTSPP